MYSLKKTLILSREIVKKTKIRYFDASISKKRVHYFLAMLFYLR